MIRIDHILVSLTVTVLLFLIIFLTEIVFTSSFDKKYTAYTTEFSTIELAVKSQEYSKAVALCNQILAEEERGMNEIRAKAYLGMVYLRLHQDREALQIFRYLMDTYPGIKMVYEPQFRIDQSNENVYLLFTSVLNDFVPGHKESVTKNVTVWDIISGMDWRDWMKYVFLVVGTIVMYERWRRKRVS